MRLLLSMILAAGLLPMTDAVAVEEEGPTVRLAVDHGARQRQLEQDHPTRGRWDRVEVPLDGTPEQTAARLERNLGLRVVVERAYKLGGPEDEPSFDQQWGLENTGQTGGTLDADIDALDAWNVSTGTGVVIAVVDSGVEISHQDLDDNIWTNASEVVNGVDDDGNGLIDDVEGWDFEAGDNDPSPVGNTFDDRHGTYVAGVVAAEANGVGITGVAPDAKVMNLRACDNGFCWSLDAAAAIYYAVDMGAHIVNLSFGSQSSTGEGDPPLEDAFDYARSHDVLIVTAAGNTHPNQVPAGQEIIPAELPHANNLAVAATDHRDLMASFSYYSQKIDIAAPGVSILSTNTTGYGTVSGTSFAAPHAAGVAALLVSTDLSIGYEELMIRLMGFVDHPGAVEGKVESGRLNAGRALTHQFVDAVDHLFESDIEWAADQGITKGCNPPLNTLFCPDEDVSRKVMAAFLKRALNLPQTSIDYFSDDNGSIFENDINRLAEAGITKGCNPPANTHFCPDQTVDRGQMAAFLVRAFALTDNGGGDLFDDDDNSVFENDIDRLGTAGITKGCNPPANNHYCPNLAVNRGAMTAFLHRALD